MHEPYISSSRYRACLSDISPTGGSRLNNRLGGTCVAASREPTWPSLVSDWPVRQRISDHLDMIDPRIVWCIQMIQRTGSECGDGPKCVGESMPRPGLLTRHIRMRNCSVLQSIVYQGEQTVASPVPTVPTIKQLSPILT